MSKISACLIVRDSESTLEECLFSLHPHVDEIVVVDTGSTDGSPAIAQKYADKWERYTGCNVNPLTGQEEERIWDFSDARNRSFALASYEWAFWADADDRVIGAENLRAMAAAAPPGPFAYLLPYEYSYDATGNCNCIHWRERLIRPAKDFVWSTPCHEVCMPRVGPPQHQTGAGVIIKHRAQEAAAMPGAKPREPARNLRILEAYLKRVGEGDPRAMYYCGVEYARHGLPGKARQMLRRYTELSGWSDERCLAQLELGRIHLGEGDCEEAIDWAFQALKTKSWPDPYWLITKAFFRMAIEGKQSDEGYNLKRAASWAARGRPLEDAQTVLFYNPTERFETERFVNRIFAAFGDIDGAAESCRRGLSGLPGDPELMGQLRQYEQVRIGREIDDRLAKLVHLGVIGQPVVEAVEGLLTGRLQVSGPAPANDTGQPVRTIGSGTPVDESSLPPVPEGKLDIVIFTGPAMEPWNPASIEASGIGGSETMAWEMARGLARLGHRVRHYGQCRPEQEGVFDGVHWLDATKYVGVNCDALVVSRYADALGCPGINAKVRLLWLHDVHAGAALTPKRAVKFDRVLCLSNWHKEFVCSVYPYLDPGRVVVTRNGIDLGLFEATLTLVGEQSGESITIPGPPPERDPHRAVYSSSPDRGLQTALELWPLIRAEVPDAELHVFYGFAGLRAIQPALADALETKAYATEGVVLHGRVPPRELAQEFLKSGVLMYPTWFSETFAITAAQAQAAGMRTVTSPIAALKETVLPLIGNVFVRGAPEPIDLSRGFDLAPCTDSYKESYVARLVDALTLPDRPIEDTEMTERENLAHHARRMFGLDPLAADWSAMLESLVASLALDPVPPFYVAPEFDRAGRGVDETEAA